MNFLGVGLDVSPQGHRRGGVGLSLSPVQPRQSLAGLFDGIHPGEVCPPEPEVGIPVTPIAEKA